LTNIPKTKIKITSSCGHESYIHCTNFISKGTGILCKNCKIYENREKAKNKLKISNDFSNCQLVEYESVQYFTKIVSSYFNVLKTNDGCKADIIIRPNNTTNNKWMMIQAKSCSKPTKLSGYTFSHVNKSYENCLIYCFCLFDKKMWLFSYEEIKQLNSLKIGINNSKYNFGLVKPDQIINKLNEHYNTYHKFTEETCMIPTSPLQQEHYYRQRRIQMLPFLEFVNPHVDNAIYDFTINSSKHQEKVAYENKKGYQVYFTRKWGQNKKDETYKLNDNDFYWIWIKNTTFFYVFPQDILYKKGLITEKAINKKLNILLFPTRTLSELSKCKSIWTPEYLFDLENLNKNQLINLLTTVKITKD